MIHRAIPCVLLAGTLLSHPPLASGQVARAPEASRYGVDDDHIVSSPEALQRVRDAGFGWVHYLLYWNFANPAPGAYDWSAPDTELQRLADAGLNVYVRIVSPPTWTIGASYPNDRILYCLDPVTERLRDDPDCRNRERRPGFRAEYTPDRYPSSYDRAGDFRAFVDAAVRRYHGRVRAWGFGTEIHNPVFWLGDANQFFDEILRPGYETVKAIDPTLLVIGPDEDELGRDAHEMGTFETLVRLEQARGVRAFDVLSFHFLGHTFQNGLADLDARIKPVVDRVRDGRPFWLTELGSRSIDEHDGVAAGWLQEMLAGVAARPWIDKAFVYRLKDTSPFDFGLLNEDDSPKASFVVAGAFLATQQTPRFYYLAEGATKGFFNLDIAIANPNDTSAPVKVSFLKPDGTVVLQTPTLAPRSRITLNVDTIGGLAEADVSTVVESTSGVPLAVERTMFWDDSRYGGHTDTAVQAPATTWFFAEGAQGFFDTYVLIANSNIVPVTVTVTFLRQGGGPLQQTMTVGATARGGFCACEFAELLGASFGMTVEASAPIIAERAMYFGSQPFWTAGHESAGVPAPATTWFMAEGRTGPMFDEYVLISNPNDAAATVAVEFTTSEGQSYPFGPLTLAAKGRETIYVDGVPGLEDAAVSTRIVADLPVLAERAMYWPGNPTQWYEAHNSFGVTETGTAWALAEGRAGTGGGPGDPGFETYILVYNTTDEPAQVTITYLPEGAPAFSVTREMGRGRTDVVDWPNDPRLQNRAFGALIQSNRPIVVERAMYWRGSASGPWGWGGTNATAVKLQ